MKQRILFLSPSYGIVLILMTLTLFGLSSCGLFKSSTNKTTATKSKVPTSYGNTAAPAMSNLEARMGYIGRFKAIAISEMERTGVPASITLAQGLLESDAGRSQLSANYNNHFGIKCHSTWQGERYYQEDDDKDPLTGQLIKSCFRVYKSPEESYLAHSEFLRDPLKVNRYGFLFQLPKTDYVSWARGLQTAGYATASDYGAKLIKLVEDYQLAQYDNYSLKDVANNMGTGTMVNNGSTRPNTDFPVVLPPSGTVTAGNTTTTTTTNPNSGWLPGWDNARADQNPTTRPLETEGVRNDTKYARAFGNMSPYELAGKYGISITNLQTFNEELPEPRTPMAEGTVVYLQKKRNYWRGTEKTYRVQDCETMYDIAQKFGVKLTKLYSKNEMRQGEQPAVGQILLLRRGWFQGADKPALRDTFGEWRRCKMPAISTNPTPNVVTNPTLPPNGSGVGFEITPGGSQPSTTYYPPSTTNPSTTTTYPTTTYPTTTYPTTTYPSTTTTYPSTTTTYPTTTYPSTTTTYPTTTYVSVNYDNVSDDDLSVNYDNVSDDDLSVNYDDISDDNVSVNNDDISDDNVSVNNDDISDDD